MRLAVAILLGASSSLAFAQAPSESEPVKHQATSKQAPAAASRSLLLGVDENGNGIRDDIEAIAKNYEHKESEAKSVEQAVTEDEERPLQKVAIVEKPPKAGKPQQPRPGCFDYLMRSPKDRHEADLRVRGRTNSVPGTHPCDPVTSPLLERPYETEYVDLGPVIVRP